MESLYDGASVIVKGTAQNLKTYREDGLEKGQSYVLFLNYDKITGKYVPLTGYQGIYKIEDGKAKNSDKARNLDEADLMKRIDEKKLGWKS